MSTQTDDIQDKTDEIPKWVSDQASHAKRHIEAWPRNESYDDGEDQCRALDWFARDRERILQKLEKAQSAIVLEEQEDNALRLELEAHMDDTGLYHAPSEGDEEKILPPKSKKHTKR